MKDQNNDSTSVLARFGRDKRTRTVKATAERVERRPRSQRDAADSEQPHAQEYRAKRTSYNPHFTADNRPKFEHAERASEGRVRYGRYADDRERSSEGFGSRTEGEQTHRTSGRGKPAAAGSRPRSYRTRSDASTTRASGDSPPGGKPASRGGYGEHGAGTRAFKPYGKPSVRRDDSRPASYPKYDPARQTGAIRLNRFLAQSGICSRREADDFITAGVVSVTGKIVPEPGTKVPPTDEVRLNDRLARGSKKDARLLHTPQ